MAGHQACLSGLKIAVSGVFDQLSRDDVEDLVKSRCGKLVSSVTSVTHYLVIGKKLEDGRDITDGGKYKGASSSDNNCKIITLLELIDIVNTRIHQSIKRIHLTVRLIAVVAYLER